MHIPIYNTPIYINTHTYRANAYTFINIYYIINAYTNKESLNWNNYITE